MASCRTDRDLARGRRAAVHVRGAGGSALQAAVALIEATVSTALRHSTFKDRVAALIRAGAGHPEAWTRYRRLAELYPIANLDAAIMLVERMRRAEVDAHARAIHTWGH